MYVAHDSFLRRLIIFKLEENKCTIINGYAFAVSGKKNTTKV